jgi:hydrogenase maturation protease
MTSSIVIGIGNPVIADDAVGIETVRHLRQQMGEQSAFSITELYTGGMELMEAMIGYDRAFVVDAMVVGNLPGTIHRLGVDQLADARNTSTTHNGSLASALELGRATGIKLPSEVRIWGVEAGDVSTFCEELTPEVRAAVPIVAQEILRELLSGNTESQEKDQ